MTKKNETEGLGMDAPRQRVPDPRDMDNAPPTVQYATREETLDDPKPFEVRYKDIYCQPLDRWFLIRSLNDFEYSKVTALPVRPDGKLDKQEVALQDARIIIACCVRPDRTGPLYVEADMRKIRGWDSAITLNLAGQIREHLGVPEEQAIKNG